MLLREKISLHFVDIDRLKLTCVLNRLKVYDTLSLADYAVMLF